PRRSTSCSGGFHLFRATTGALKRGHQLPGFDIESFLLAELPGVEAVLAETELVRFARFEFEDIAHIDCLVVGVSSSSAAVRHQDPDPYRSTVWAFDGKDASARRVRCGS
ncbi:MAG: hypothetical protein AB7O86_09955, partial [Porticoccaceae bacterium]